MTVGQCFNTQTRTISLASSGTPSFPEGNVVHEPTFFDWMQALQLDFTAAGIASYTRNIINPYYIQQEESHHTQVVPVPQAGNQRLDSTPSSTTPQCNGCLLDTRVVWVTAWTNVLCVLGMLAFGVDVVLPHSWFRSFPQT